jgi:NADP-dependent 3-hydroxy acid dehydrogenase YdfG
VVATARRPETLADLPVAERLALDVTDDASVRAAVAAAGEIDALVSNAGEIVIATVEGTPLREFERLLQVNTIGALRVTQAVLPAMRERGSGRVLFLSSVAGRVSLPMTSAYAATKWALEAIAEALAVEAGHFGVSVSLLQPGAVSSGALDDPPAYLTPDDPYLPLAAQTRMDPATMITVDAVAVAVAEALEDPEPPLRIPVGEPARRMLAARRAADDTRPFVPMALRW